jgi:predicted TIM-barrel fold metal-dependent hydrolase
MSRRTLLTGAGSSALIASMQGCMTIPTDWCKLQDSVGKPLLVIDTHAHFFNSSDVHVERLLSPTLSKGEPYERAARHFASFVKDFAWAVAPGAERERKVMAQIRQVLSGCSKSQSNLDDRVSKLVDDARQEAYSRARSEILSFVRQKSAQKEFAPAMAFAFDLPDTADEFFYGNTDKAGRHIRSNKEVLGSRSYSNFVEFIIRQLQYRCVNYFDYLGYMSTGADNAIDLAIYHLLDFDYPLGMGEQTPTSVPEQVDLLSELTILSQGRVHGFVPFDPMKAVMHRTGRSPLDIVKDAVENKGFIGVKIYPPMGFAALGNANIKDSFWRNGWWLPDKLRMVPNLGRRLDEELVKLYDWCGSEEVPIMGHTNVSIGPSPEFEALVAALYWEKLVNHKPGLRINFGHFGNTEPASSLNKTIEFMDLMRKDPNNRTKFVYADSGHFVEFVGENSTFERALKKLNRHYGSTRPGLFDRFMFGTDWNMVTLVSGSANYYLAAFEKVMDVVAPNKEAKDNFFGRNAAVYLGLARGERTRRRLERFYVRHSIAIPDWMIKVDQII